MSKRLIITVSEELYQTVEKLAKDMGVTSTEYVRFLILKAKEQQVDGLDNLGKKLGL